MHIWKDATARDTAETVARGLPHAWTGQQAAELPEGSWFVCDLEGMEVLV